MTMRAICLCAIAILTAPALTSAQSTQPPAQAAKVPDDERKALEKINTVSRSGCKNAGRRRVREEVRQEPEARKSGFVHLERNLECPGQRGTHQAYAEFHCDLSTSLKKSIS
jgi:hypothetical protein